MSNPVALYYWNKRANFGDSIAPFVLRKFARLQSRWCEPENADLVLIGSALEHIPTDWTGIIAGAGKLHESTKLKFPDATILAVRGPLTAKGLKGDFVLGDPGLLADELVGPVEKQYNLGIVPHWTDSKLEHDPRFTRYNPKIIRVDGDPLDAVRQIGQCRKIVSSSLHGIILADAFGIPRRTEIAPRMLTHAHQEGGVFKFRDYNESIGLPFEIGLTQEADRPAVVEKQHELYDVMREVRSRLR